MVDWPILSIVTFLPLAGAAFIFVFARGGSVEVIADKSVTTLTVRVVTSLPALPPWGIAALMAVLVAVFVLSLRRRAAAFAHR